MRWTWQGKLGPFQLSADVTSSIQLNVLTGRIVQHIDEVSLQGNPVAQLLYRVQKGAWGTRQGAKSIGSKVRATRLQCNAGCMAAPALCARRCGG